MTPDKLLKKQLKQAHKDSVRREQQHRQRAQTYRNKRLTTGIVEGEHELPADYPVYFSYCYTVKFRDGSAEVVSSPFIRHSK